ncbi:interaptin [Aphis gossypii]|uniref:interaptin n=1 Tax=Aphis gossypii TaxID=80765 RepID=UPI002158EFBF|nr:interaptin [Aphis gossypii]
MTTNVSPSRSNLMSSSHPSKGSLTDRPSSCSNKSLVHNKSCPVHSRHLSYKTIGQCHDKIEELEKQNARLVSKIKVLKYQLKTSSNLYNNIHQRPEKPLSRHSQRSTPIKLQKISRLSRVGFDENEKTIQLPERKFESTESFDSESSLVENKSKFKENIELIQSHRVIKSMEIKIETLQAQCKDFEQNVFEINELLDKERDEHDKLKEQLMNERHNLSELKPKYNAYKETNKALEEQIRDLQKEKLSLKEHNQKLLQLTSKPNHQNSNGLKLKELEENFSDTRAGLLKQMEENSKYIAELKGIINENEVKLSNYADENKYLKNQHSELSKILELKENEIKRIYKEIDNIRQENDDLKNKLQSNINNSKENESEVLTMHQNLESEDKRLKNQIQELQQEQLKINQTLNSQSYLNTMLKDKVDQSERDIKTAIQFIKICMNLFKDITTLDLSEPLMATLEIVEKAVCSIKKSNEINVENKEYEEIVNDILEVLVMFRDQMVKRRTMINQEQLTKIPIVNLITDTITKSENTPRIQENSAQLEININSVHFSTESIRHLKSLKSEPNIFLTWGFKDQEDVAYSPSRLAWSANFNCSCFYRSNNSAELLHFVAKHGLFINVHLVTGKSSPVVAAGLVNTVDSINNPMVKFNLIVPIMGQNIDAKLKCSIQLICDFHEIQTYSQMIDDEYSNIEAPINKTLSIPSTPNDSY